MSHYVLQHVGKATWQKKGGDPLTVHDTVDIDGRSYGLTEAQMKEVPYEGCRIRTWVIPTGDGQYWAAFEVEVVQ